MLGRGHAVAGVPGEPGRRAGERQRRGVREVLVLGGPLQHPPDQGDADGLGFQRPRAGGVDPARAPLADQAQQRVDLPHPGPGQRMVQQRRGVGADRRPGVIGEALQVAQVPHRVGGLVGGQVSGVGDPAAGAGAGMDLDQRAAVAGPHELAVRADLHVLADQVARHRVQGPGDLDVVVAVDFRAGIQRQVVGEHRGGQQPGCLFQGEQLGRAAPGGPVDPLPGPPGAPGLCLALRIGQAGELLAGEEAAADERHHPLDAGLVGWPADPGRVDHEAPVLRVLGEGLVEAGIGRVRPVHDRGHVDRGSRP